MTAGPAPADADGRTTQARGVRRRQEILDAAVELFAEKGFRGAGLAALAERVDMTPTGVLYYFGSKARLLEEVVAERIRGELDPTDLDVGLRDMRGIGRFNAERPTETRLFHVLAAESFDRQEPLHDFFADRFESARAFVRGLVEDGQSTGHVNADADPDQIAREFISVVLGLEVQWLMDPDRIDYPDAIERYVDRLLSELTEPTTHVSKKAG